MNKDRVSNLIRKLFRTGQGRTFEAARARERVGKLTKKYGLNLRSVIDGEKKLSGVVGDYWRSALLVGIAKSLNCQVLDQIEGRRRFAVVSGRWDDVSRAVELYRLAEVQIAVKFTAWWRGEAAKLAPIQPTYNKWGEPVYRIPSQHPPAPRFTLQQARQVKPILLRFMAVSVAETFAADAVASAPHTPPSNKRRPSSNPYTRTDSESRAGVPCEPPAPAPPPPSFGRRPHIPHPSPPPPPRSWRTFEAPPPPSHEADTFDDEIQKLVAILGQDEAKALGEGALDSGVAAAVALREIVQKPMLRLSARSEAFPRAGARIDVDVMRARAAEHVRRVISRFPGAR